MAALDGVEGRLVQSEDGRRPAAVASSGPSPSSATRVGAAAGTTTGIGTRRPLALALLLLVGAAAFVSAVDAGRGGPILHRPAAPLPLPLLLKHGRRGVLRPVRGGAAGGAAATAAAAAAPPGFFTIAERFQALATTGSDAAEGSEQEGDDDDEEGEEAAAASRSRGKAKKGQGQGQAAGREELALRAALQYSVVAIVGPQASGKSTLLNALFGTRFPVLDARATGIQRTTRGVWVDLSSSSSSSSSRHPSPSPAASSSPLVVLDTEGLESVARGVEGSGLFDRQVSTLAVAAADVVLLNLWARDVRGGRLVGGGDHGGEEGAGLHAELLRALVQTAASASGQGEQGEGSSGGGGDGGGGRRAVSLVVVLRDSEHRGGDLAVARDAMRRALHEAAEALGLPPSPPAGAKQQKAKARRIDEEETGAEEEAGEEVMEVAGMRVAFAALPSRAFQQAEFEAAAGALKDRLVRFVLPALPPPESRLQPVPLPRFPSFAEQLWASIVSETGGLVGGEGPTLTSSSTSSSSSSSSRSSGVSPKEERRRRAEEQVQVRAFVRRKALESCCLEAEPAVGKLERKVEAATEMPILEFGRDAEAIFATARRTLRARLSSSLSSSSSSSLSLSSEAEGEAVAALGRRLEPCFRQHVEALGDYYFGKFQDKFLGMYHPAPRLDKEARALVKDVLGAFDKAAGAAVPPDMTAAGAGAGSGVRAWSCESTRARLKDEMDLEVADRRMEVEVLFPTPDELTAAGLGRRFFLRPSWWRKVALKALVVYINYLQTVQAAQSLARSARRRQETYPPVPLF